MKTLLLAAAFASCGYFAYAQRTSHFIEGTLAAGQQKFSGSAAYRYQWNLGKKQKFSIGLGARLTTFTGNNQFFETAPAQITSGKTGLTVIFTETIPENIDSIQIANPAMTMLNAMITLAYRPHSRWEIGFNIDAVGFTLGGEKQAQYWNGSQATPTTASPTRFNALLTSDNDLGSLNSELWLAYGISQKTSLKIGYQFLFTEYSTATNVQTFPEPNDRFRNKGSFLALGVLYKLR
jgi:hypothetical protein